MFWAAPATPGIHHRRNLPGTGMRTATYELHLERALAAVRMNGTVL